MKTSYRDDAIARNRIVLKMTIFWAASTTVAVIVLSLFCFYAFSQKETHWLPLCTGEEFSIGNGTYSATYLEKMTEKVADLRLTYNPNTIAARFEALTYLIPVSDQNLFKKRLDSEKKTVQEKNISSVFYSEKVKVDTTHHKGQIEGLLYRTSHGLEVNPVRKTYQFQFSFERGLLGLQSIKEIHNGH